MIALLHEAGFLSPDNTSGYVPSVPIGHVILSPFAGHNPFSGPFCMALLAFLPLYLTGCHLVPPLILLEAIPPPGIDTSSFPIGWYSVERWERRLRFLMLNVLEECQSCVYHVSVSSSAWWYAFVVFNSFYFPSLHTHTPT